MCVRPGQDQGVWCSFLFPLLFICREYPWRLSPELVGWVISLCLFFFFPFYSWLPGSLLNRNRYQDPWDMGKGRSLPVLTALKRCVQIAGGQGLMGTNERQGDGVYLRTMLAAITPC